MYGGLHWLSTYYGQWETPRKHHNQARWDASRLAHATLHSCSSFQPHSRRFGALGHDEGQPCTRSFPVNSCSASDDELARKIISDAALSTCLKFGLTDDSKHRLGGAAFLTMYCQWYIPAREGTSTPQCRAEIASSPLLFLLSSYATFF